MQRLYVEKRKTITGEELLDITSVGRSLPGTMIGNVAMLYGNHAAGLAGGRGVSGGYDPAPVYDSERAHPLLHPPCGTTTG